MTDRRSTSPTRRPTRRGFTFMEILFAVMILGIGFIMVAAMFPAALRQTQGNIEAAQFNVIARTAQNDMQSLAYAQDQNWYSQFSGTIPAGSVAPRLFDQVTQFIKNDFRQPFDYDPGSYDTAHMPTKTVQIQPAGSNTSRLIGRPIVYSFNDWRIAAQFGINYDGSQAASPNIEYGNGSAFRSALWDTVRGNVILADSHAYAWVPLWSRSKTVVSNAPSASSAMQLFIFPVRSRAKSEYDPQATVPGSSPAQSNPSCDLTYDPTNLDPVVVAVGYIKTATNNAPYGVISIHWAKAAIGTGGASTDVDLDSKPTLSPMAEGCFVVISDHPTMPYYNGTVFRVGPQSDVNGNASDGTGAYWSVAEVHNLPTQYPWSVNSVSDIGTTDMPDNQKNVLGLVIGRGVDPTDPRQHSDSARKMATDPNLLPRVGTAQELGYYPSSIVIK